MSDFPNGNSNSNRSANSIVQLCPLPSFNSQETELRTTIRGNCARLGTAMGSIHHAGTNSESPEVYVFDCQAVFPGMSAPLDLCKHHLTVAQKTGMD